MTDLVLSDRQDGILTLTLNRPELRNPISDADMVEAVLDALAPLNGDIGVRCVILTGAGPGFSSGGNINKMGEAGGLNAGLPAQTRRNYKDGIQRLPLAFEALEVPVIAAVNGAAIGAGCDLALMCDIRIAGQSAKFAESFVKLGIVPGDGGAWLLPRVVGFSKACEMALTGDLVDAEEALACGLVSKVVPDAGLMDAARALAAKIAANPPHAMRLTKKLLRQGWRSTLDAHLDVAAAMQALAHATRDHNEAIAAFKEKRKPDFTGE
ncbi:crotonase/enoyl-CoA hydratase family protein [Oceanibaculum pacificum]|uniref:Enoyl-CoA hydratase n=1 Tax=Oceanibaculum pacificum TaxID=580166 RepID=A0A154VBT6_9PROT|nr:crotonase/enoyl-CoA hydratase family protein [Oceanibaculum pacificum]KZC98816.1 enoyl-CoA hydratase [Oceanibaculum pacificum]